MTRFDVPGAAAVAAIVGLSTTVAVVAGSVGAWWPAIALVALAAGLSVLVFGRVDEPAAAGIDTGSAPASDRVEAGQSEAPTPSDTGSERTRGPRPAVALPEAVTTVAEEVPASEGEIGGWRLLTVPKLGNPAASNEDAVAVSRDGWSIAIADGASSAFASSEWSRGLVDTFVADQPDLTTPEGREELVGTAIERWVAVTSGATDWWSDEARSRGSFAALVGLSIDPDGEYTAVAVGDSCLFVFDTDGALHTAFPMTSADEFNLTPQLVGTIGADRVEWASRSGRLGSGQIVLLATDGLAQWLLGDRSHASRFLSAEPGARADLLQELRRSGEMVNDDIAAAWRTWP